MADTAGAAQLGVLPGTRALPIESPEVVNPLVIQLLRGGPQPGW